MLRCTKTHESPRFGIIPAGSLWADDSEYVVEMDKFEDADKPKPKKVAAKKSAANMIDDDKDDD